MLRPVTETSANRIALTTWPHLRSAKIKDGYELAFSSRYGDNGPQPDYPMVTYIPAGASNEDWESVSPRAWQGTTPVTHNGVVVFEPGGAAPVVNTAAFTTGFKQLQTALVPPAPASETPKWIYGAIAAVIATLIGIYIYSRH